MTKKRIKVPAEIYLNAYIKISSYLEDMSDSKRHDEYDKSLELVRKFERGEGNQEIIDRITANLIEDDPRIQETLNLFHGKERK